MSIFRTVSGTSTAFGCDGKCSDDNLNWTTERTSDCSGNTIDINGQSVGCNSCTVGGQKSVCSLSSNVDYNDIFTVCEQPSCPTGYDQLASWSPSKAGFGGNDLQQKGGTFFLDRQGSNGGLVITGTPPYNSSTTCYLCGKKSNPTQPPVDTSVPSTYSALWVAGQAGQSTVPWSSPTVDINNQTVVANASGGVFNWGTLQLTMPDSSTHPISVLNLKKSFNNIQKMNLDDYTIYDYDRNVYGNFTGCASGWSPIYLAIQPSAVGAPTRTGNELVFVDSNGTQQKIWLAPNDMGRIDSSTFGFGFCLAETQASDRSL